MKKWSFSSFTANKKKSPLKQDEKPQEFLSREDINDYYNAKKQQLEAQGGDLRALAELKSAHAGEMARFIEKEQGTYVGESGGPQGLEPTRYGDWEKAGRCFDF